LNIAKQKLAGIPLPELYSRAKTQGLRYPIGPFNIHLNSNIPNYIEIFAKLYAFLPLAVEPCVADFHLKINKKKGLRSFWRRQAVFSIDSVVPFEPYPYTHAFPLAEWGLNWCIGMSSHQYVILHSAVLEYKGIGVIFPAMPGSGKSTLCSALMLRGWRLLSDEFGLIETVTGHLIPIPRAIPLKNDSIDIISNFSENAIMGPVFTGTRKGDVAHLAPTQTCFERQDVAVKPGLVIFPQYHKSSQCQLLKEDKSTAFTRITKNSFNYHLSQKTGFRVLSKLIQNCDCYSAQYNGLNDIVDILMHLVDEKHRQTSTQKIETK